MPRNPRRATEKVAEANAELTEMSFAAMSTLRSVTSSEILSRRRGLFDSDQDDTMDSQSVEKSMVDVAEMEEENRPSTNGAQYDESENADDSNEAYYDALESFEVEDEAISAEKMDASTTAQLDKEDGSTGDGKLKDSSDRVQARTVDKDVSALNAEVAQVHPVSDLQFSDPGVESVNAVVSKMLEHVDSLKEEGAETEVVSTGIDQTAQIENVADIVGDSDRIVIDNTGNSDDVEPSSIAEDSSDSSQAVENCMKDLIDKVGKGNDDGRDHDNPRMVSNVDDKLSTITENDEDMNEKKSENEAKDVQATGFSDCHVDNSTADQTVEKKNDAEATTGPAVRDDGNTVAASTSSLQPADIGNGQRELVRNPDDVDTRRDEASSSRGSRKRVLPDQLEFDSKRAKVDHRHYNRRSVDSFRLRRDHEMAVVSPLVESEGSEEWDFEMREELETTRSESSFAEDSDILIGEDHHEIDNIAEAPIDDEADELNYHTQFIRKITYSSTCSRCGQCSQTFERWASHWKNLQIAC